MSKDTVQCSVSGVQQVAKMLEIFAFPSGDNGEDEMVFKGML